MRVLNAPAALGTIAADDAAQSAVTRSGVEYVLSLVQRPGKPVADPGVLKVGSIVRVLRGEHAGRIGRLDTVRGGRATIATYPIRYRRRIGVVVETCLRLASDPEKPLLEPKIGDTVWTVADGRCGNATVVAVDREYATVRQDDAFSGATSIARVPLCPEPAIEVLIEPAIHAEDGTEVAIADQFALAFGEIVLEAIGRLPLPL